MIKLEKVSKEIDKTIVLKDITYTFKKGKTYALIGRNGSGKTMLLRLLCNLIKPTSGTILINDKKMDEEFYKYNFGVLIEKPKFLNELTGYENLELLASIKKIITKKDILDILDKVCLLEEKDKKYSKYSLGMKQKLALAQALMEKPNIILLDEPFNGLDTKSVDKIRKLILSIKNKDTLIIIATHSKEDVEILCDEEIFLEEGKIVNSKKLT